MNSRQAVNLMRTALVESAQLSQLGGELRAPLVRADMPQLGFQERDRPRAGAGFVNDDNSCKNTVLTALLVPGSQTQ